MGIIRILVDSRDYRAIDLGMSLRGYTRTIPGLVGGESVLYGLPPGTYWIAEPSTTDELLRAAKEAALGAREVGARIIAVAGPCVWEGLIPIDDE